MIDNLKIFVLIILLLIHRYKPHGYMLMKYIQELTHGMVKTGPGKIYPLLFLLKHQGLIRETESDGRRKRYELTEKGIEILRNNLPKLYEILANLLDIVNEELERLKHH